MFLIFWIFVFILGFILELLPYMLGAWVVVEITMIFLWKRNSPSFRRANIVRLIIAGTLFIVSLLTYNSLGEWFSHTFGWT